MTKNETDWDKRKCKCGVATKMHGKYRVCERISGHSGRHMAFYCGRRRYWDSEINSRDGKEVDDHGVNKSL